MLIGSNRVFRGLVPDRISTWRNHALAISLFEHDLRPNASPLSRAKAAPSFSGPASGSALFRFGWSV